MISEGCTTRRSVIASAALERARFQRPHAMKASAITGSLAPCLRGGEEGGEHSVNAETQRATPPSASYPRIRVIASLYRRSRVR